MKGGILIVQDTQKLFSGEDDSIVFLLEPFHGVVGGELVLFAHFRLHTSTLGNSVAWALHNNVEIHTIDT